ncbi:MAG: hypothetical protein EBS23_01815 [Betaproteobacteria bacterium]|nr:hypothetical protein [Betaproteobacteria bacterium]
MTPLDAAPGYGTCAVAQACEEDREADRSSGTLGAAKEARKETGWIAAGVSWRQGDDRKALDITVDGAPSDRLRTGRTFIGFAIGDETQMTEIRLDGHSLSDRFRAFAGMPRP